MGLLKTHQVRALRKSGGVGSKKNCINFHTLLVLGGVFPDLYPYVQCFSCKYSNYYQLQTC